MGGGRRGEELGGGLVEAAGRTVGRGGGKKSEADEKGGGKKGRITDRD